jgi:aspartate 1-decarboxylase
MLGIRRKRMALAADFYPRTARTAPTVEIYNIEDGRRFPVYVMTCASKREARKIAADHGATPWNF